jgi:hypothetical protein
MERELHEKQISVEKFIEILTQATGLTLSQILGLGRKSKKLKPTEPAGMLMGHLLSALLTELGMFSMDRVEQIGRDIMTKALETVPNKYK